MKIREKIAFALYMINSILCLAFGFKYLFCNTIMPYHEVAIGKKWAELEPGLQVMLNGFVKITASAFFLAGIAVFVLLIIPYRRGERWAKWFIPALASVYLCFGLYVSINVALNTQASTPWPASVAAMAVTLIAFFLSGPFSNAKEK